MHVLLPTTSNLSSHSLRSWACTQSAMCGLCPRSVRHRSTLLAITVFWGIYAFGVYTYLRNEEKTVQQNLEQLHQEQDYQQKPGLQGQQQQLQQQEQQKEQRQKQDQPQHQHQQAEKEQVQQGGQLAGRQEQRVADQVEEDDVVYPTYVERGPADGPGNSSLSGRLPPWQGTKARQREALSGMR